MEIIPQKLTCRKTLLFSFLYLFINPLLPGQTAESEIPNAWINEIHYDNSGTDVGEAIEIVVETDGFLNFDIQKLSIELYNGSDFKKYNTYSLPQGTVGNPFTSFSIFVMEILDIQNGDPDGIALVYEGYLIQFISYEGSFEAADGSAQGVTSTDIGVTESGATPEGYSLQLSGVGDRYQLFTWSEASPETFGKPNEGQNLVPIDGPQPVTDFQVVSIAPDKVGLSWTKPIGVHGEDWSGVLVFGSFNGSNEIAFEKKDYSDFDGSLIFGDGGTPTENGFTIARRQTDSNGEEIITNLNAENYHFAIYTYLIVDGGDNDIFLEDFQEIEIAPKVADATNYQATPLDEKVKLSWTNSMGELNKWWDEIMIIASENPIATVPNKASYSANAAFGRGESPATGEYVVYKGSDSVTFVEGLENGKNYHFKIFVRYDSGEDFFWSSGMEVVAQPSINKKYWSGGAGNNDFADDGNWSPAGKPGIAHDVILDNSIVTSSYDVISSGDEEIALNSLTISPQSTDISIKFSSINNNSKKLILHDNDTPLTISNNGILINNITHISGTVLLPNGKMVLENEGKYVHNTGSGSKEIFDNIELTDGIIPGTIEFINGGTTFISISARSFQELIFSSETSATYTSAPGSNPVTIKKALTINENCKLNLGNLNAPVHLEGDLMITGNIEFDHDLIFDGTNSQNFSGSQDDPVQVKNIVINKLNDKLSLGANIEIKSKLEFMNGNIATGENKVLLNFTNGDNPQIIGAPDNGKTIGNLEIIRNVASQETEFAYAGVSFKSGSEDLGAVSVIRSTGSDVTVSSGEVPVIDRNWEISTSIQPTTAREVTFSWTRDDENDLDPLQVQLWQESETRGDWAPIGEPQDGTSRSITAMLDRFSKFAISDTHNPLPITLLSFEVRMQQNYALVSWTTGAESNNAGFEVEKSMDGKQFFKIGFVQGANNSNKNVTYEYKDHQFFHDSYYRLKQLDYDGKYYYSPIRFLTGATNVGDLAIFPNPIEDDLSFKLKNESKENYHIDFCYLVNSIGIQKYQTKNGNLSQIERDLKRTFPNLEKGIYIFTYSHNLEIKTFKILKR
jgi:hypothetical protein